MTRRVIFGSAICCFSLKLVLAAMGQAAEIRVGNHDLLPDTPGQPVEIYVDASPGDEVAGLDLYVQVGDGGAIFSGTDTGPVISDIDVITDTIFATNNTGQQNATVSNLAWALGTTTASDRVPADGLLATIYLDTTGMFSGDFPLLLSGVGGVFDTQLTVTGTEVLDMTIFNGEVTVIPEPAVTGLLAVGSLVLLRRRRCS